MARTTRSAATERAYLQFAPSPHGVVVNGPAAGGAGEEFDESDIWGAFAHSDALTEPPPPIRRRPLPASAARKAAAATKPVPAALAGGGWAAHGSLPVNIPDWSKILGDEYHHHAAAGDWELDDGDDEDGAFAADAVGMIPPHELAWRRRAASMSAHEGAAGALGRTLKVRDAVWKRTTGFQD
jgi:hypothetical protein